MNSCQGVSLNPTTIYTTILQPTSPRNTKQESKNLRTTSKTSPTTQDTALKLRAVLFPSPEGTAPSSLTDCYSFRTGRPLRHGPQWVCAQSRTSSRTRIIVRRTACCVTARTECYSTRDEGSSVDCTNRRY